MRQSTRTLVGAAIACTFALSPCAFAAKWQVTDLGPVGLQSWLYINNQGQVAGTFSADDQSQGSFSAFVTGPNGTNRRDLYPDNSLQSIAGGINDAGQVLSARGSDNAWEQQVSNINTATVPTFLTVARAQYFYSLGGINRNGVVVGSGDPASGTTYGSSAYIVNADGSGYKTLINEADPLGSTSAGAIVYSGRNNGWASIAPSATTASVRLKGSTGTTGMVAYSLNDKGQVAGTDWRPEGPRAFVTGANGSGTTSIGLLGSKISNANAVNSAGIVGGDFGNNFDFWHAMITDAGGKNPRDLSAEVSLPNGGFLTSVHGINDKGQVVALDYYNRRAYLLTPIGESDCAVTYKRIALSNKSVATQVTVANLTSTTQTDWNVKWRLDTRSRLSHISGAKLTMSGNSVSATPTNNGTILGNSQVSFMFLTTSVDGTAPTVAEVTGAADGQTCKVILP